MIPLLLRSVTLVSLLVLVPLGSGQATQQESEADIRRVRKELHDIPEPEELRDEIGADPTWVGWYWREMPQTQRNLVNGSWITGSRAEYELVPLYVDTMSSFISVTVITLDNPEDRFSYSDMVSIARQDYENLTQDGWIASHGRGANQELHSHCSDLYHTWLSDDWQWDGYAISYCLTLDGSIVMAAVYDGFTADSQHFYNRTASDAVLVALLSRVE